MRIIGIDPGETGAIAIIEKRNLYVVDIPIIHTKKVIQTKKGDKRKKGNKRKAEYDSVGMANLLAKVTKVQCHVFIEKVHSMPGQGVASTFNFGMGYGIWIGILAALKLPHTFVTPQSWKKSLMKGHGDKDAGRLRVLELYPEYHDLFSRKKDIGRADAVLIATYGKSICEK